MCWKFSLQHYITEPTHHADRSIYLTFTSFHTDAETAAFYLATHRPSHDYIGIIFFCKTGMHNLSQFIYLMKSIPVNLIIIVYSCILHY